MKGILAETDSFARPRAAANSGQPRSDGVPLPCASAAPA